MKTTKNGYIIISLDGINYYIKEENKNLLVGISNTNHFCSLQLTRICEFVVNTKTNEFLKCMCSLDHLITNFNDPYKKGSVEGDVYCIDGIPSDEI